MTRWRDELPQGWREWASVAAIVFAISVIAYCVAKLIPLYY